MCCGEGGALQTNITGVCGECSQCLDLVDAIQKAYRDRVDGIVFNPAAYTHTTVALLDALLAVGIPTVEVHISAVERREDFRQISYVRRAALETITGRGIDGYCEAMDYLIDREKAPCE